jgi:hypothetical protein
MPPLTAKGDEWARGVEAHILADRRLTRSQVLAQAQVPEHGVLTLQGKRSEALAPTRTPALRVRQKRVKFDPLGP